MRKTGFTLIELLAVIVILAIIALIAVPIVLNIISNAKEESIKRSVELYVDTVQKKIAQEQMRNTKYNPNRCEIRENGNVICYKGIELLKTTKEQDELEIEMNGKKPESGRITIKENKVEYTKIVLEGFEVEKDSEGITVKKHELLQLATDQDYRGYYADVNGDDKADGVIYADLGANITYPVSGKWGSGKGDYDYASEGEYSYEKKTGLKEYTVSKEKYKKNEGFREKEIISLKSGSTGNARFYVMALEDFKEGSFEVRNGQCLNGRDCTEGTYYWYKNAIVNDSSIWGRMPYPIKDTSTDFGTGYTNTGKIIEIWNNNGIEEGWTTGAIQDDHDIFKHIQQKYKEGWYIPSRGEWGAFSDYFFDKTDLEIKLTKSNYNSIYGLSNYYWSSSQSSTLTAWGVAFNAGSMVSNTVDGNFYVRVGATF